MSWGSAIEDAISSASDSAKQSATALMASASQLGQQAATFGEQQIVAPVVLASQVAGAAYRKVTSLFSAQKAPAKSADAVCPYAREAKKERLQHRQDLIDGAPAAAAGQAGGAAITQAANRLALNNQAVELARLSADTYAQYGQPPVNNPPAGWTAMSDDDMNRLSPGLADVTKTAKAVIYQTSPDWPGGQQTVVAFRGTVPNETGDLMANANQAFGSGDVQYTAAVQLGRRAADVFGPDTLVTGHSLGGGKAQAAGISGGLDGMMFNAAGINPATVDDESPSPGQFQQFRTKGDPLTGSQNSALVQGAAMVLSPLVSGVGAVGSLLGSSGLAKSAANAFPGMLGNLASDGSPLPAALGTIHEVNALDNQLRPVSMTDGGAQHDIGNLVNGIEQQKTEDVKTLESASSAGAP